MKDTDKELLKELVRLDISQEDNETAKGVFTACPDVAETLANPLVTQDEKHGIIKRLVPQSMERFLMNVIKEGAIGRISEILEEYTDILIDRPGSIRAVVRYVTPLTDSQQADLKQFIMDKFVKEDVAIEYRYDPDILGGFILNAGDEEYDKSYRTALRAMKDTLQS
ncbi:MAG: ATP synthase F1 subunit delta, partial [Ruminococcus sp.]|nr:ATP synthase F1 subunit delta [Ruminococcus sp.]